MPLADRWSHQAGGRQPDEGASKHKLALGAGFTPPNERSRQHLSNFDSYIRLHHIFDDQKDVYDNLRFASDHFEHGSRGFDEVQAAAHASADLAFGRVRHAILREIGVPAGSSLLTEEKYQYPLAGWQPACQLEGSYVSGRAGGWPDFYGMSIVPSIVDIEDLDDDQKRNLTFTFTASGDALLDGQEVTPETYLWATPLPPDRKAEQIAKEEVLTRRGTSERTESSQPHPVPTSTVDSVSQAVEHPVEVFRRRLAELTAYPPGVVPVPKYLRGTAFFSAAAGLVVTDLDGPLPVFPFGGVMFVGHNLDSEMAFLRRLVSGQSHGGPDRPMLTWRNLYRLLEKAEIRPSECFFTNVYVGLKAGDDPTGRFPGAADPEFRAWCRDFLQEQITVMRPRVVATLGNDARRFVATMAPELAGWASARNPPPGVVRARLGSHESPAVALLHPSGYHGSLGHRRSGNLTGLEAEAALLREALG